MFLGCTVAETMAGSVKVGAAGVVFTVRSRMSAPARHKALGFAHARHKERGRHGGQCQRPHPEI